MRFRPLSRNILRALIFFSAALASACSKPSSAPVKIRVSDAAVVDSAPLYVAMTTGIFARHGLEITIVPSADGPASMKTLAAGRADIACTGDMVASTTALADDGAPSFAVIGVIEGSASRSTAIVADAGKGIREPRDLKGKRIGLLPATAPHYFLDTFLLFNRIPKNTVKLVAFGTTELPGALARGDVDAVALMDPHISASVEMLGPRGKVFYAEDMYNMYWLLCSSRPFLESNPAAVRRFLAALNESCAYISAHPGEAASIVASFLNMNAETARERLRLRQFALSLTNPVMIRLENQSRWAIRSGLSSRKNIPYLPDYFDASPMRDVKPETVTLIY